MEGDVGWVGLAASLSLVAVAVGLSWWLGLRLERPIAVATARAAVQLIVAGAALGLVIDAGQPIVYSWLWVAGIVVVAAVIVRRRAPELPGVLGIGLVANSVTTAVSMGLVFGLGIFPMDGRAVIPVAGMTIGNALTSTVVAATLLVREMGDKRDEVEARLALGLTWRSAVRPSLVEILRASVSPQIERTRNVGVVFLPGAMVGLILAGVEPLDAVLVQGALMYVIVGSVVISTVVTTLAGARRLFTQDHRLIPLARPARSYRARGPFLPRGPRRASP